MLVYIVTKDGLLTRNLSKKFKVLSTKFLFVFS